MNHRPWRLRLLAAAAVIVVAAVAVAAAAAGNGGHKQTKAGQIAALKRQVTKLSTQNKQLRDTYTPAGIAKQLARVKAALDKYQDVAVAKADGYAAASPCEMSPVNPGQTSDGGVMGIHFVNPAYQKPGPFDPTKPPILVYNPTTGGGLQLVAVEYFKPDADQNTATGDDRPSAFGRAFDGPMQGHAPGMPIHYDLHVWLWKHNPSGMFAPWNPAGHC